MADRSRAGIKAEFVLGKASKSGAAPKPGAVFRVLVMADFGGHQARGEVRPGSELRPQRVDLDTFPSVLRKIAPRIQIGIGDQSPFTVTIEEMEGFHPDHLFANLEFFAPMRELRRQLLDAKAFPRAAALLGKVSDSAPPAGEPADGSDDLQRLLGRPSSTGPTLTGAARTVDALIRQVVAPHVVGKPDPRQEDLVKAVDGMSGELMRAVLHDRGFQRLEAAWRGLDRMVRALELGESLQVFVLDASREELAADFAAAPNLADSAMYHIVVDHGGETPWSLLVAGDPCGRRQEDAALLARLGTLAQEVEAALVAGMDWAAWTSGPGSLEDQRAWAALRISTAATSIGIAAPGILLRLPYGKATDPIEGFAFFEQTSPPAVERHLWGTASFVVAQLLAQSFAAAGGWDFAPGDDASVSDLPTYAFTQDGESVETPCAQSWLPESKIDALIKEGLMPLVAARGRGEVRVPRFQSIASPSAALAGRWRND